jgi:copper chaperone NosL
MTMKSKIAFASKEAAEKFVKSHGGEVSDFAEAYAAAVKALDMSRPNIDGNRKKKGKIKEPSEEARCVVCGMFPARYPRHRCQILTKEGKTLHFCSTRCLMDYRANPSQYVEGPESTAATWVTVYPDGGYDYGPGLYYVVGSKVWGPMGHEALPFRKKVDALDLTKKEGGKVVRFNEITPAMLTGGQ